MPGMGRKKLILLIEPLWNWNVVASACEWFGRWPFNRTIVELKHNSIAHFRELIPLLIEPLWNWNRLLKCFPLMLVFQLLIEPLWNWNKHLQVPPLRRTIPFNRTIVELKRGGVDGAAGFSNAFNRTIVELKLFKYLSNLWTRFSFNRTIVELKHAEPEEIYLAKWHPFNRTIVELKPFWKNSLGDCLLTF